LELGISILLAGTRHDNSIGQQSVVHLFRRQRSSLADSAGVGIIIYFSSCIVVHPPVGVHPFSNLSDRLAQGIVVLLLVVGKDGHPYNIRLGQSLGMGLDEKAIEAVSRWRSPPATLDGQPVSAQIAVQVDFHLY